MHFMSSIPRCNLQGLFWWRLPPASKPGQKSSCRRSPNHPSNFWSSGPWGNAAIRMRNVTVGRWFSKTSLVKGSYHFWPCPRPPLKTNQLWVHQLMHFMPCIPSCNSRVYFDDAGLLPANLIEGVQAVLWREHPQTHRECDCQDMTLLKTFLITGSYHCWPCPRRPLKKNIPGCVNSCTSCHLFCAANCRVCFDGAGLLPAHLGQKPSCRRSPNRPSKSF